MEIVLRFVRYWKWFVAGIAIALVFVFFVFEIYYSGI